MSAPTASRLELTGAPYSPKKGLRLVPMYDLLLAQIDYASAPPFLRLRVLRVPHGSVYRSTVFYAHGPATLASADQEDRRPRHRTAPCRRRAPLRRAVPRAV